MHDLAVIFIKALPSPRNISTHTGSPGSCGLDRAGSGAAFIWHRWQNWNVFSPGAPFPSDSSRVPEIKELKVWSLETQGPGLFKEGDGTLECTPSRSSRGVCLPSGHSGSPICLSKSVSEWSPYGSSPCPGAWVAPSHLCHFTRRGSGWQSIVF